MLAPLLDRVSPRCNDVHRCVPSAWVRLGLGLGERLCHGGVKVEFGKVCVKSHATPSFSIACCLRTNSLCRDWYALRVNHVCMYVIDTCHDGMHALVDGPVCAHHYPATTAHGCWWIRVTLFLFLECAELEWSASNCVQLIHTHAKGM
jgi:hypothetical protein